MKFIRIRSWHREGKCYIPGLVPVDKIKYVVADPKEGTQIHFEQEYIRVDESLETIQRLIINAGGEIG